MKKLPTLYKRTSTGKVQVWTMVVDKDTFYSIEGLQGCKMTQNAPTVCEPKNVGRANETSAEEQAVLEAEAKWKKKAKTGYFENVIDIDNEFYFEPMLAKDFEDFQKKIDWTHGVGVQIKFNGGRIVARKEGLFTRKGEKYVSIPHIEEGLKPLFEAYPNLILDGEGYNYDLREQLNEVMKLLRKTVHVTPEDLEKSKELVRFYVYDGFGFTGDEATDKDTGYLARKKAIDANLEKLYGRGVVERVDTAIVYSEAELEELYKKFLADRQEGAILRVLGVPYENKRSKYLLKYKPEDDAEGIILDIIEGVGNWAGTGKVIKLKWKGKIFKATFRGPHDKAVQFLKDKDKWIGKEVTFLYTGLTGKGIPNYARVDINNCLKK